MRLLKVKSLPGKEMSNIQPDMQSQERAFMREPAEMQEPAKGEMEPGKETTTALFYRYAPSLFAFLRQHTVSREDAEDLLHEVFTAVLERPEFGLLSDVEQALWLWRVTRNKAVDTYRRKKRHPSLALDYVADELYAGEEQSPEDTALRREEYTRLLAALEQLPEIQQEALRLRFGNELSCANVARALGKGEGAVRSILSRALARLRSLYIDNKEE
jgi:RNA polymerase sigma-70 factor (ECF subfamily)